ncbi:MAG: MATE family efflux transporter [Bacteroidetes bacterium RIFCSPLOWO2_12_FULL_35_15]|nr:MAG: MATE family efflux transporter [Bacteroidetes bacterium RIFCSPLOWO2_12_FULL_35_15]
MKSIFSPEYSTSYRKTFFLAYPVVLSQLGHIMVGVVDTAMVGQIGTIPQAAVALANSLYILVLVFGLGVSYGVTPLVAVADSSKNHSENAALLKHGILINTAMGVLLFLLLIMISPMLNYFNQKQEVVDMAIPFLNVMMLGMIPLCIFSGFKQFTEGLSFTRVAMLITVGTNILNILLNYLMIFGHWGFPEMGLMGSCWASFISRVVMALAMFAYVYYNKNFKIYWHNFNFKNISKDLTKKILALGVPSGLQWVFEVGAFSCAVIMIGWISPMAQAAHQVALSIAATTYMMASGLSAAASVRVGNQLGLKSKEGVRTAGFSAVVMALVFMSFTAICFILFRNVLPVFFSIEPEVISISASLLIIAAFFQLSDGTQVVCLGALRGIKDVTIPTIITLIAYWIIGLPMSYFFAFKLNYGVQGVWYGLSFGLTTAAILLFFRFNYVSKRI